MGQCCAKGDKSSNRRMRATSWGEDSYYPPEHLFAQSAAKAGGYSIPGWSNGAAKTNQDRGLLVLNFGGNSEQTMMLVCDGHGPDGHHASQGVVDAFLSEVEQEDLLHDCRAAGLEKLTDILTRAVYEAEETTFIKKREGRSSGTTFTMAIICGTDLMFTANVGDSRSAIGTVGSDGKAGGHDLTVDHAAAHNAPECQRIVKAGGKISSFGGSQRVLSPGGDCALCPTRSVGDCEFGRDVVICTPEVVQHKLGPEDKYVVVASDGLWEFLKCSQVMAELNSHDHVSAASLNLVDFSQHEWFTTCGGYCDDITLVVAELPIKVTVCAQ